MMRVDHLVLATPDPASTIAELADATGVTPFAGGAHPGLGTRNWLVALATEDPQDRAYLEIIGPDPEQPEPASPRPFGLDDLDRPSFAWWCARADDLASLGTGFANPMTMERQSPEGLLQWDLAFPVELDGATPFVIDWLDSTHPSTHAPTGLILRGFTIEHPEAATCRRTLAALGDFPIDVVDGERVVLRATLAGPAGTYDLRTM
ncbi:MAG: VOC family protein [Actinomycetota bacterium]